MEKKIVKAGSFQGAQIKDQGNKRKRHENTSPHRPETENAEATPKADHRVNRLQYGQCNLYEPEITKLK
jgi:hypothetical protein